MIKTASPSPPGQHVTLPSKTLGLSFIHYKGEVYTLHPTNVDRATKVGEREGVVDAPSIVLNPTNDLGGGTRVHVECAIL